MKKILFGSEASEGGAFKHLLYLINNLDKNEFAITVVISDQRQHNEIEKLKETNAEVIIIPMVRKISIIHDTIAFIKVVRLIKSEQYDIVHAHSSKAGVIFRIAAWLNKTRLILYTPHCFYFQSQTGINRWFFKKIEQCFSLMCHGIIVSDHEKDIAMREKIASEKKLININNAIDFKKYKHNHNLSFLRQKYNIPPKDTIIGSVGRLTKQKDWFTYIRMADEVIKKQSNITFLIVGNGELQDQLLQEISIRNLTDKIILTGYVESIDEIYSLIDIYVSTSLWEGLPYVFLEAAYYSKPAIITGTYDYYCATDNFGFICIPITRSGQIGSELLNLVNNGNRVKDLGRKSYDLIIKKYSFQRFVKAHRCLYINNSNRYLNN